MPIIPERLRIAATQGIVIPFVGAGVSQLGGCPGWDDFATAALRFFLNLGKLDHAQFDQLSRLSARVRLSVAVGLEQQHETRIDFNSILEPYDPARVATGLKIYGYLALLARVFVTTNYDKWLDLPPAPAPALGAADPATATPSSKRAVHYLPREFTDTCLSTPDTVLHIHGSVTDRDSMILTTSNYLDRYASHRLIGDRLEENPPDFSRSPVQNEECSIYRLQFERARGVGIRDSKSQGRNARDIIPGRPCGGAAPLSTSGLLFA